jgi:hypothetical protein
VTAQPLRTGDEPVMASPTLQPPVVRRAYDLCVRAEPHTKGAPCEAHMQEANRQLLRLSAVR